MPPLTNHVDDFSLLRYAVGDMPQAELAHARSHLRECPPCSRTLLEVRELDRELASIAQQPSPLESDSGALGLDDPFRRRPLPTRPSARIGRDLTPSALIGSASSD